MPVLVLIVLLASFVGNGLIQDRERGRHYASAELSLAVGDLVAARKAFSEADEYRDAVQRVAEVDHRLEPFQRAYTEASALVDAGEFDEAIPKLVEILRTLPNDADALDLLERARVERLALLERQADEAEHAEDWLAAERALAEIVAERPDDTVAAARLSVLRRDHSPVLYSRLGSIYISDLDQVGEQPIVEGMSAGWPAWSPDRSLIAFMTVPYDRRDINGELYVVRTDGSDLRRLSSAALPFGWPVWSPDGAEIAFTSAATFDLDTGEGHIGIHVVDVETGRNRDVTGDGFDFAASPSWAPDGGRIAFVERHMVLTATAVDFENGDVWIVDLQSGSFHNVTADGIAEERQVYWSPTGEHLAVITDSGGWGSTSSSEIYLVSVSSGDIVQLPTTSSRPGVPVWSPDGRALAFVEDSETVTIWSEHDIQTVTVTTRIGNQVSWSPDGSALILPASSFGQPTYIVRIESLEETPRQVRLLFDSGTGVNGPPMWMPRTAPARPIDPAGTALDPAA